MSALGMIFDWYAPNRYALKHYPAPGGQKAPFAVICPGGGYGMVASSVEGKPYAKKLNEMGFSAFVLRYRCGRKARFPAPMDDLAQAVRYILAGAERLNVQRAGYSVWGSSAGGHLAASFGTQNMGYSHYGLPKPGAIVLAYPVISMGPLGHSGSTRNLLGKCPDSHRVRTASIDQNVSQNYPPTYIWNSTTDELVSPQNGALLADALQAAGVPHVYRRFESGRHGCGLATGTDCEPWFAQAVSFWRSKNQEKNESSQ